jgi:alcohol dehydrogenase, propanol-preferring
LAQIGVAGVAGVGHGVAALGRTSTPYLFAVFSLSFRYLFAVSTLQTETRDRHALALCIRQLAAQLDALLICINTALCAGPILQSRCRCGVKAKSKTPAEQLGNKRFVTTFGQSRRTETSLRPIAVRKCTIGGLRRARHFTRSGGFHRFWKGTFAMTSPWLAMELHAAGKPLQAAWREQLPPPGPGQVRIRVAACGVCRTDLHLADGDLPHAGRPIVPGHEIVGHLSALGADVQGLVLGQRVGVPWLGWTCGACDACRAGEENLCAQARFTGWQMDGGYAEYVWADARFVLALPARYSDEEAAPLLCAGLIGYRAFAKLGAARRVGLYGFGAAAHLIAQVAVHQGREVWAFTRPGDAAAQALARELGASWAGGSDQPSPVALDAALIFAPLGALVPTALAAVRRGGTVVCAGIHMSDIPSFPYALLWGERVLQSVAHLTRADGQAFMRIAAELPLRVHTQPYALAQAQQALDDLRAGRVNGAAVLLPGKKRAG